MATNWTDAITKGAQVLGELTTLSGQLAAVFPGTPVLDGNGNQQTNGHSILMDIGGTISTWLHRQNIAIGNGTVTVTLPHAWDMNLPLAPEARTAAIAGGAVPSGDEQPIRDEDKPDYSASMEAPRTEPKPAKAKPPGADAS